MTNVSLPSAGYLSTPKQTSAEETGKSKEKRGRSRTCRGSSFLEAGARSPGRRGSFGGGEALAASLPAASESPSSRRRSPLPCAPARQR